ncbi:hypothetical protein D3C71_1130650 [compost metagenome]
MLPARIPAVGERRDPGVLVQVEAALGHDVVLAFDQLRLDHPDAVQFPAQVCGVGKILQQHVAVLGRDVEAVVVVGDEHLSLTRQRPCVAVERAAEVVELVVVGHARDHGRRRVVAHRGQLAHTPLPGEVSPALRADSHLVQRIARQDGLAGTLRRLQCLQLGQVVLFPVVAGRTVFAVVRRLAFQLIGPHHDPVAASSRHMDPEDEAIAGALPAQQVVPHGFGTGLRNRKWDTAVGALDRIAIRHRGGPRRVLEGVVIHPLRRGS